MTNDESRMSKGQYQFVAPIKPQRRQELSTAKPQPNCAKRLECGRLLPLLGCGPVNREEWSELTSRSIKHASRFASAVTTKARPAASWRRLPIEKRQQAAALQTLRDKSSQRATKLRDEQCRQERPFRISAPFASLR